MGRGSGLGTLGGLVWRGQGAARPGRRRGAPGHGPGRARAPQPPPSQAPQRAAGTGTADHERGREERTRHHQSMRDEQ